MINKQRKNICTVHESFKDPWMFPTAGDSKCKFEKPPNLLMNSIGFGAKIVMSYMFFPFEAGIHYSGDSLLETTLRFRMSSPICEIYGT